MGTPAHKPTQRMNCTVTISHMSKEELAAKYGLPSKVARELDKKYDKEYEAFLKAFQPKKPIQPKVPSQETQPKILLHNNLTVIRRIYNKTAELYEQGMAYQEAFGKAKKLEGWK